MPGRSAFQPNGLPQAAQESVPALLAVGNFSKRKLRVTLGVVGGSRNPDQQLILLPLPQPATDLKFKGQIAPFMLTQTGAVQPDLGKIIGRAEVKNDCLAGPGRRGWKGAPVPGDA